MDWIAHCSMAHLLIEVVVFYGLLLKGESLFLVFACLYVSGARRERKSIAAMYILTDPGIPFGNYCQI